MAVEHKTKNPFESGSWGFDTWKDGYDQAIKDVMVYLGDTDLPIDIEHWMKSKKEFSAEVVKAAIEEIKSNYEPGGT